MKRKFILNSFFILIGIIITLCLVSEYSIPSDHSPFKKSMWAFAILITIWNLLPIIIYYFVLKASLPFWKRIVTRINLILSGAALVGYPTLFTIGYKVDFHGMATSSSTASLSFLVLPVLAIMFGIIPVIIQMIYNHKMKKKDASHGE